MSGSNNQSNFPSHTSINGSGYGGGPAGGYEEDYNIERNKSTITEDEKKRKGGVVAGAAAAGGIAGLVLVGPIVAVAGAIGGAVAAASGNKVAKNAGQATADVGGSVRDFDKKHDVSGKTMNALSTSAKAVNQSFKWVSQKFNNNNDGDPPKP